MYICYIFFGRLGLLSALPLVVERSAEGGVLLEVVLVEASAHTLEVLDSIGLVDGALVPLTVRLELSDTGESCKDIFG